MLQIAHGIVGRTDLPIPEWPGPFFTNLLH